jgi:hypothetical protein
MPGEAWIFLIPVAAIVGGCTITIVGIMARARVREAEIRERIALIERGLVPSPESDPAAFEAIVTPRARRFEARPARPGRFRRGGIVVTGIGLGMMVLFAMNGESDGIGVGAFIAIIGLAFFVSSFVSVPAADIPAGFVRPPGPPAAAPRGPSSADSH